VRRGVPGLGVRCELEAATPSPAARLFAEATGFVCEVRAADAARCVDLAAACGVTARRIGTVLETPQLEVRIGVETVLDLPLAPLAAIWRDGLRPVIDEGAA
jgi:selenophosphate synthetase-related protein